MQKQACNDGASKLWCHKYHNISDNTKTNIHWNVDGNMTLHTAWMTIDVRYRLVIERAVLSTALMLLAG